MLHKLKQEEKHLTLDDKKNLTFYYHLKVQYLDGPSGGVERGALAALVVTGLLPQHSLWYLSLLLCIYPGENIQTSAGDQPYNTR